MRENFILLKTRGTENRVSKKKEFCEIWKKNILNILLLQLSSIELMEVILFV